MEEELLCAITHQLPFDPVTAMDGRLYERSAIEEFFEHKKDDDLNGGDAVFRDDPSTSNGSHRNGSSGYSDEPENGSMEMNTMPAAGSPRDEAALRPGKSIV